ncbi:unnamed protein product [Parnassius apollo]|uniref:(apollo) hypothetical protein n=1 Tax=Parnassius apollo TaxID=110799 RepID=A0A8S3W4Q6_PARAO|nr:unnamed protein product [Parnassius apollo]
MHSSIEPAKKNSEVYCMSDYLSIFKRARSNKTITVEGNSFKTPYKKKEFKYNEIYDLKKLADETVFNRSKNNNGNQVKWLKIKRIRHLHEESSKIYFNYDMSVTFLYIDISKNTEPSQRLSTRVKKGKETTTPQTSVLKHFYLNSLPISEVKKRDLLSLCTKKIIPEECHGLYSSLPTATNQADRLPEPSIDEELSDYNP